MRGVWTDLDVVSTDVVALVEVPQRKDALATVPHMALALELSLLVLGERLCPLQHHVHILCFHSLWRIDVPAAAAVASLT